MASHLEMAVEENIGRGISAEEARSAGLVSRFGGIQQSRETAPRSARIAVARCLDAGFAFHLPHIEARLRRSRLSAVLILALGIGANIAVFSVVNTILLRPLPFRDSATLVRIVEKDPKAGRIQQNLYGGCHSGFSATEPLVSIGQRLFRLYRTGQFQAGRKLSQPVPVTGILVAGRFLSNTGVKPSLGRLFKSRRICQTRSARGGVELMLLETPICTAIPALSDGLSI